MITATTSSSGTRRRRRDWALLLTAATRSSVRIGKQVSSRRVCLSSPYFTHPPISFAMSHYINHCTTRTRTLSVKRLCHDSLSASPVARPGGLTEQARARAHPTRPTRCHRINLPSNTLCSAYHSLLYTVSSETFSSRDIQHLESTLSQRVTELRTRDIRRKSTPFTGTSEAFYPVDSVESSASYQSVIPFVYHQKPSTIDHTDLPSNYQPTHSLQHNHTQHRHPQLGAANNVTSSRSTICHRREMSYIMTRNGGACRGERRRRRVGVGKP